MEYTIVTTWKTLEDLIRQVNEHIRDGWVPVGAFVYGGQYGPFYQTMTRTPK